MTYFEDGTPYEYWPEEKIRSVRNVGWISAGHPIPAGEILPNFTTALSWYVCNCVINLMRGVDKCDICGEQKTSQCKGRDKLLGCSEIWVRDEHSIYAAPSLITHFVSGHGYAPPIDFQKAIISAYIRGTGIMSDEEAKSIMDDALSADDQK